MNATIHDRSGRPYALEFDLPTDSHLLIVKVFSEKHRIGYANCFIMNTTILLQDIHISDDVPVREFRVVNFIQGLARRKPKTLNYRGRGIGTGLLLAVLQYARERGMHEVRGRLGPLDWKRNPNLPNWYRKHGFSVSESGEISRRIQ